MQERPLTEFTGFVLPIKWQTMLLLGEHVVTRAETVLRVGEEVAIEGPVLGSEERTSRC